MAKLIVAFRNFANAPEKGNHVHFVAEIWIECIPCRLGGGNYTGCSRWRYLLEVR